MDPNASQPGGAGTPTGSAADDAPESVDGMSRVESAVLWLLCYGVSVVALLLTLKLVVSPVRALIDEWLAYGIAVGVAVLWLIALLVMLVSRQVGMFSRRVVAWLTMPALALACVALIANELPSSIWFNLSRPALEQAADQAQAGEQVGDRVIGLESVGEVKANSDGTTLFFLDDNDLLFSECGLAYKPNGTPDVSNEPNDSLGDAPLAPGWWLFCQNM